MIPTASETRMRGHELHTGGRQVSGKAAVYGTHGTLRSVSLLGEVQKNLWATELCMRWDGKLSLTY